MSASCKEKEVGRLQHHWHHDHQASMETAQYEVRDDFTNKIKFAIPSFEGNFDPKAYIEWELVVDNEFDKYDLNESQKISIPANAFTESAITFWKSHSRHNRVPRTWKSMKTLMRVDYVSEYFAEILSSRL